MEDDKSRKCPYCDGKGSIYIEPLEEDERGGPMDGGETECYQCQGTGEIPYEGYQRPTPADSLPRTVSHKAVKFVCRAIDHPDPPLSEDFTENLENINNWNWYDNYQHGKYENENTGNYGPIKVFNARVLIDHRFEWHGDVSERRLNFFKDFSKKFENILITIAFEHGESAYVIGSATDIIPRLYKPRGGL